MDVRLVMFKPDGQRKDLPIVNAVTVVGRGEKCDIRVPLLSVSRQHCELRIAANVKIKDLGSSNGTYVNNKRINETVLRPGDRLVIGPVVFTVQIDGQPQEISPIKTRGQKIAEGQTVEEAAQEQDASDEIVDLEADLAAQLEKPAEGSAAMDPISALEALAAEDEQKKKPDKE